MNKKSRRNINLGFSVKSVQNILDNNNWVNSYRNEIRFRFKPINPISFQEKAYINILKLELEKALNEEIKRDKWLIRRTISKWIQIAHLKAFSLFKIKKLIIGQLTDSMKIIAKYKTVPLGPLEKYIIDKMNKKEINKWRNGNLNIFYSEASISNILGLFISEMFFATESMLRLLCIGHCLEFAIKSILPHLIIQHDEIHKSLVRLSNPSSDKITCKLCILNNKCLKNRHFNYLASIYELTYHLRIIKDYKKEIYFNNQFSDIIIKYYIPNSMKILYLLDEIIRKTYKDYLISPYTLKDFYKRIDKILK